MNNIKKVLIIGGSSDIGQYLLLKFLKKNYFVTAHYSKNKKKLVELKKKYKNLEIFKSDFNNLTNKQVSVLLKNKNFKNHDIIVNLVGFVDNKSYDNFTLYNLINSLKINSLIPNLIIRNNMKFMENKKWGRIVNCSTIGLKFGGGKFSYNYNLSKHCLEFIPNKYKAWAKKNILINNIRVGVTKTKIHKRLKKNMKLKERLKLIPMHRMAEPEEISESIFYYSTNLNSYITGQTISIAGGE